ncbi:MAG: HAD family hydrolase [Myxococcota bacterium]|jgi:putative hydrolase of the HAD superfamily|nr:HAD family hydrolase [Myxococcota bacterium]
MSDATSTCIVWDVDDTLYLERDYVRSGFTAVGQALRDAHGIDGFGESAWRLFEAGVRGDTFDRALADLGVEGASSLVPWMVGVYREHRPDIALCEDAAQAVAALSELPMAAITDGPLASQQAKVDALGVADFASPVILTATLGPGMGKPHPRAFEAVMTAHGGAPERFVYVADNPHKDFIGPRALGWRTVRLRRPLGLHAAALGGDDIDAEITTLAALRSVLAA